MATVSFTLTVTDDAASPLFPAGTVCAGIQCLLNGSPDLPILLPIGTVTGEFANVPDGDYTFSAHAVDQNGVQLGDAISGPVSVKTAVVDPAPLEPTPAPAEVKVSVPTGFIYTVA